MKNIKLIIITGNIASGKTTFLKNTAKELETKYSLSGFFSIPEERKFKSGIPSRSYYLQSVINKKMYLWAKRKNDNSGFEFIEESQKIISEEVLTKDISPDHEVLILDDIGMLEILGNGFDHLLHKVKERPYFSIIVSVKKSVLETFIKRYGYESALIIDLDEQSRAKAAKKIKHFLFSFDSEKIALYSAINAGIEVGIGSTLHALRVPLKGHFLAHTQNFLLIQYAKELKGRNLFWIVFITSALKSFSPAGAKLMPMIYILVQGSLFVFPVALLGVNFLTMLIGSILLGLSTLVLGLLVDYITFGQTVIEAYIKAIEKFLHFIHLNSLSVWTIVLGLITLKVLISLIVATSYFLDFSQKLSILKNRISLSLNNQAEIEIKKQTFRESVRSAFSDMFSMRFLLPFVLISLIIFFFSDLGQVKFATVILRGLILAWVGFLVARRIDFDKIVGFLEKHDLGYIAESLKQALRMVLKNRK